MPQSNLKIIHIEDENDSRRFLQTILSRYASNIEYVGFAESLEEGKELILNTPFDLLFLDVTLPDGEGLTLVDEFPDIASKTILCTANEHKGIEATNKGIFYYLLKPIDIQEVQSVIEKYRANFTSQTINNSSETLSIVNDKILIPDNTGVEILTINDIFYLEADNNYTKIYKKDNSFILSSKTLKSFEETLINFVRIHRSFLVNPNHIQRVNKIDGGSVELSNNISIKVSPAGREEIRRVLNV